MNAQLPVQPHDLLWGMPLSALPAEAPAWAVEAIGLGHPVVVRRARVAQGHVAVGVRGRSRDQRYACAMRCADITRVLKPEQLKDALAEHRQDWPALHASRQIQPLMDALDLPWGIAGSAGFELASGIPVLHRGSDLDLILRTEAFFTRQQARELTQALADAVCRIDLQLQVPAGAVALREWASASRQVMLKAADGARLVDDPWQVEEGAR